MNDEPSPWLPTNAGSDGRLRLVCFPHVGGGTAMFHRWARRVPQDLQVVPIKLPGREDRSWEPAVDSVAELVDRLTTDLLDYLRAAPFAFFGHSMGGLISYEWSQRLRGEGIQPRHMFISACRPATKFAAPQAPLHTRPDDEMIQLLNARYGTGEATSSDELTLMRLMAATIRADLKLLETYTHAHDQPLSFPLSVLGGAEDKQITRTLLQGWQPLTEKRFSLRIFPGGHFYLRDQESAVISFVASRLAQ